MDCIILQNTHCACLDMSLQLNSLIPGIRISYMTEEALEVVNWLEQNNRKPDCIIADTEACDGNTVDIFRRSAVELPLILTCSSPDEAQQCNGLNLIGTILKPVCTSGLKTALSPIYRNF